uniref:Uncharacterized protein n=1 Tax=Knipowitschia caucasica TaxID=637954 RepID=A0AAV2JI08_KNICA
MGFGVNWSGVAHGLGCRRRRRVVRRIASQLPLFLCPLALAARADGTTGEPARPDQKSGVNQYRYLAPKDAP